MKNKTVEKLMRFLITLLGAGIGAALAALILPLFSRWYPIESPYAPIALYAALCLVGAAVCFAFSSAIIGRTMKLIAAIERRWDAMPTQQIVLTSIGMIMGLVVAALITQLILSAGASLITISFSALTYVVLGYVGLRIGFHRYRGGKTPRMRRHLRRAGFHLILKGLIVALAQVVRAQLDFPQFLRSGPEQLPLKDALLFRHHKPPPVCRYCNRGETGFQEAGCRRMASRVQTVSRKRASCSTTNNVGA